MMGRSHDNVPHIAALRCCRSANVLLSQGWRAALSDFGVAQVLAGSARTAAGGSSLYAGGRGWVGGAGGQLSWYRLGYWLGCMYRTWATCGRHVPAAHLIRGTTSWHILVYNVSAVSLFPGRLPTCSTGAAAGQALHAGRRHLQPGAAAC